MKTEEEEKKEHEAEACSSPMAALKIRKKDRRSAACPPSVPLPVWTPWVSIAAFA